MLSALDVATGRVDPGRLVTHGLVVIGLVLRRIGADGGGDRGIRPRFSTVAPGLRTVLAPGPHHGGRPAPAARRAA